MDIDTGVEIDGVLRDSFDRIVERVEELGFLTPDEQDLLMVLERTIHEWLTIE